MQKNGPTNTATQAPEQISGSLQIGEMLVDCAALTVAGPTGTVTLEPKVMAVLQALADRAPAVVPREALIDQVWGSESGGDESLSRAISLLRKALGDQRGQHRYIETIPRRGYRLVAPIAQRNGDADASAAQAVGRRPRSSVQPGRPLWLAAVAAVVALALAAVMFWPGVEESPQLAVEPNLPARSVAVLPFTDMSRAADEGYFAAGLAEEILNALTTIPQLSVAGRTSSFAYAGKEVDIRQIGSELGVNYVVEGSVRKDGEQLRITAQLVRADNGYHVWSRTFDGRLGNVFDFQEDIARAVAAALEVSLEPAASERLARSLTENQEAYDAFLQGRSLARRFGAAEKLQAAKLLNQAVQLDPNFALAWAELARTELFLPVSLPQEPQAPHVAAARDAAERALALDPDLAMGHYVRGLIFEYELDYAQALRSMRRAHQLEPGNPFLTTRYGNFMALIGHTEVGIELIAQGVRRDPTDGPALGNLGVAKLAAGDLAGAKTLLQRSYEIGFAPVGPTLAKVMHEQGDVSGAWQIWWDSRALLAGRYLPELETADGWERLGHMYLEEDAAARDWVMGVLERFLEQDDARSNSYRLYLLAQLGMVADAFRLLWEKPFPISAGFVSGVWVELGGFAAPSTDPQFAAFAEQIGLVEAWEQYGWPARCTSSARLSEGEPAFKCD